MIRLKHFITQTAEELLMDSPHLSTKASIVKCLGQPDDRSSGIIRLDILVYGSYEYTYDHLGLNLIKINISSQCSYDVPVEREVFIDNFRELIAKEETICPDQVNLTMVSGSLFIFDPERLHSVFVKFHRE